MPHATFRLEFLEQVGVQADLAEGRRHHRRRLVGRDFEPQRPLDRAVTGRDTNYQRIFASSIALARQDAGFRERQARRQLAFRERPARRAWP